MRVLFFNYEYPPLGGGAGNASAYILREYSMLDGLEVDFVTSSVDEKYHLEKIGANVTIHRLPIGKNKENMHYQSQKDLIVYYREAMKFSKELCKKNKYDLTHSFFTVPCGFISYRLKRKFKIPYVISLRGSDVPGYSERFTLLYKLITPLVKVIWKNAFAVISNSEGLRELAAKTDANLQIGIIPNGIDAREFQPRQRGQENDFRILCVSRVTPRKGIRFLIQAFAKLSEKYNHLNLEIVGDGDEKKSLEDLTASLNLQSKIIFRGLVLHEDVPQIYANSDVFVLPSLNEGMSNTMLEALAAALPVVATDTGGTKELVSDGINGFVVKMRDSEDLADKLEQLIQHPQLVASMSRYSREKAEELSWEAVAKSYRDLYANCTKN